jgi:uncharacterized protein YlxW (UPF0749 family)
MLYALLGSVLLSGIAVSVLAWQKVKAQRQADNYKNRLTNEKAFTSDLLKTIEDNHKLSNLQINSLSAQLAQVQRQKDAAISQLVKTGAPGSLNELLRKRNT